MTKEQFEEVRGYQRNYNSIMSKINRIVMNELPLNKRSDIKLAQREYNLFMEAVNNFYIEMDITVLPNLYLYRGEEITQEEVFKMFKEWKNKSEID